MDGVNVLPNLPRSRGVRFWKYRSIDSESLVPLSHITYLHFSFLVWNTTVYTPALKQIEAHNAIDQISNFVEEIWIENSRQSSPAHHDKRRVIEDNHANKSPRVPDWQHKSQEELDIEAANKRADDILIQAEQFKATLTAPKGKLSYEKLREEFLATDKVGLKPISQDIWFLCNLDNDDEFFHVTCHIDPALQVRIQRGELVDLEKLLPKDKSINGRSMEDEHPNRLELVTQGTHQFVASPA